MARLLVEIDEDLKKELKVRLIRDGRTLKAWLTDTARQFVDENADRRERPSANLARRERNNDYVD